MARTKKKPTFAAALGERIRTARSDAGLSQDALGDALGYGPKFGQTVVSRWELGRRIPSAQSLTALARKLNVSLDYLLGLE